MGIGQYGWNGVLYELSEIELCELASHGDRKNRDVLEAINLKNKNKMHGVYENHILAWEYVTRLINPRREW